MKSHGVFVQNKIIGESGVQGPPSCQHKESVSPSKWILSRLTIPRAKCKMNLNNSKCWPTIPAIVGSTWLVHGCLWIYLLEPKESKTRILCRKALLCYTRVYSVPCLLTHLSFLETKSLGAQILLKLHSSACLSSWQQNVQILEAFGCSHTWFSGDHARDAKKRSQFPELCLGRWDVLGQGPSGFLSCRPSEEWEGPA